MMFSKNFVLLRGLFLRMSKRVRNENISPRLWSSMFLGFFDVLEQKIFSKNF